MGGKPVSNVVPVVAKTIFMLSLFLSARSGSTGGLKSPQDQGTAEQRGNAVGCASRKRKGGTPRKVSLGLIKRQT